MEVVKQKDAGEGPGRIFRANTPNQKC